MKVGVVIVGAMAFVLGLAAALLSIYVAQLGADPTAWPMPKDIGYPIEALVALERTHHFHRWLLYVSLANMVVGLALMIASFFTISNSGKPFLEALSVRGP
jgi:hypothetical protein